MKVIPVLLFKQYADFIGILFYNFAVFVFNFSLFCKYTQDAFATHARKS